MTAAEHLADARVQARELIETLEKAEELAPAYLVNGLLFVRTSIRVEIRRIENLEKILTGSTASPPA